MAKQEFNRSLLTQYQRYNVLFNQISMTTNEELEFNSLSDILEPYMLRLSDYNYMMATPTSGMAINATTLGLVVKKTAIYDSNGALLGYIPIYDSIT